MHKNYFVYMPETGLAKRWGLEITAAGYTRVKPNGPYPPAKHPADHHFTFERGRVLHAYQLIFISEGLGIFESHATGHTPQLVQAGQVILLSPGVWHRYTPDKKTGWVEHWFECQGPAIDAMVHDKLLRADQPVRIATDHAHLHHCFETMHQWCRHNPAPYRIDLTTLAIHMYAMVRHGSENIGITQHPIQKMIRQAQLLIAERANQPLNTTEIADELGIAYSYFRKLFRQYVGIPPKQYHIQMRLRKAQAMLTNTDQSVSDIANLLGFDSPYHLSQQFKRYMGLAPSYWRQHHRSSR